MLRASDSEGRQQGHPHANHVHGAASATPDNLGRDSLAVVIQSFKIPGHL